MSTKRYLLSLPERVVRSVLGLGAGLTRETAAVALPDGIRRSQLYQNVVDATLRFVIERVGGVEGVSGDADPVPEDFLTRRTAGNAIELLGIVAFRASPVWILAALSDLCGLGRHLIPEMADALKEQGLLDKDTEFKSVDQLLDGLEQTSARLAATVNTPPLDIAGLRSEWKAIQNSAKGLRPTELPSTETIRKLWSQIKAEAAEQNRSVYETSSAMAVSAARSVPDRMRWLSHSARVGATRSGQVFASALLDHYRETLSEIQQVGYATYAKRQLLPYIRASIGQFSPKQLTLTERLLERLARYRRRETNV
jgi:hypothetical protein